MKATTVALAAGGLAVLALAAAGRVAIRLDDFVDRHRLLVLEVDDLAGQLVDRIAALEFLARHQ